MELPKSLIRDFAASTNDQQKIKKDTTCYGTVRIQNGGNFVQIDGADSLTPAIYTVGVKNGDRVLIMLKGRKALVIGNITSPYLMVGTLEANDGIIINGYLTTNPNRTTYDSTTAPGLTISSGGIGAWQGGAVEKRWYGKNDGTFYASSAEIAGTITAKDGSIGGFTIGDEKLYSGQHSTWNANNVGVFISPDYISFGNGGATYLKNDGTFQFGGANGVVFNGTKVTFGESVELNVNRIKGSKTLGDWGINFDTGELTVGTVYADKIRGSKTLGDWGIDFTSNSMTIGNITANKIVGGTLTLGGSGNTSGVLSIKDASGNPIGGWSNAGISATKGSIAGWTIDAATIKKETTITETVNGNQVSAKYTPYMQAIDNANANNTAFGVVRTVGSTNTTPFYVTYDGRLVATKATITGAITAESGSIAGWTIGTSKITKGTLGVNGSIQLGTTDLGSATIAGKTQSTWTFAIGSGFGVDKNGALYATGATINGVLTAGSNSKIGPWNVTDTALWYGTSSAVTGANAYKNANGFYFGTSGLSIKDVFYVTNAGVPYCNGSNLYINSTPAINSYSAGLTIQVNGSTVGEIRALNTSVNSYVELRGSNGVRLDGSFVTIEASYNSSYGITLASKTRVIDGANMMFIAKQPSNPELTGVDPGDIIFLNSEEGELGRIYVTGTDGVSYGNMHLNAAGGAIFLDGQAEIAGSHLNATYAGSNAWVQARNADGGNGIWIQAETAGTVTLGSRTANGTTYNILRRSNNAGTITAYNVWTFDGSLTCKDVAGSSGTPIISNTTDGNRVAALESTSTNRIRFRGQWGTSGSTYSYRYVDTEASSSDVRLKTNIADCTLSALPVINKIKMRKFDWLEGGHQKIGVIADELEEIDKRFAIGGGYEKDGSINIKSVNTFYLVGYLVKAIQEMSVELERLKGAKN